MLEKKMIISPYELRTPKKWRGFLERGEGHVEVNWLTSRGDRIEQTVVLLSRQDFDKILSELESKS